MKGDKFAVIEHDRTQYVVVPGSIVDVEKLNIEQGSEYTVESVLLIKDGEDVLIGKPIVKGAKVVFDVKLHGKDRKVRTFKYKAKSRYRKTHGHKQEFTRLFVKSIEVSGKVIAKAEGVKLTKSTKVVATKVAPKKLVKKVKPVVKKSSTKKTTETKSKAKSAVKATKKVTKKAVAKKPVKKVTSKSVVKKPIKKTTTKKTSSKSTKK